LIIDIDDQRALSFQAEGVALQHNLFLADDEQPRDIGAIHVCVNAMGLVPGLIAGRNLLSALQLQNRIASADRPRRKHPIHISVGVGLRRWRKQQEVFALRHMQFWIRNGNCHTALTLENLVPMKLQIMCIRIESFIFG
jgi:hypothetical protein